MALDRDLDITLLICTHNNVRLLARALEAIALQQAPPGIFWEVLVVDNNCTDDTPLLLRCYRADPRLPSVRLLQEARQGVGHARKRGLAQSRSRLVAFVDDDCLLPAGWIACAVAFAE